MAVRGIRGAIDVPANTQAATTGAGDAFDAGFLAGWLGDGDPARALRLAVACGALSLRAVGGTDGQATVAEGEALAATLTVTEVRPGEVVS